MCDLWTSSDVVSHSLKNSYTQHYTHGYLDAYLSWKGNDCYFVINSDGLDYLSYMWEDLDEQIQSAAMDMIIQLADHLCVNRCL